MENNKKSPARRTKRIVKQVANEVVDQIESNNSTFVDPTYVRILMRYSAGVLAGYSLLPSTITDMLKDDPELVGAMTMLIVVGVEGFYFLARKFGWRT